MSVFCPGKVSRRHNAHYVLSDFPRIIRLAPTNVQSRYPIVITNIPKKVRWQVRERISLTVIDIYIYTFQELKDFGRMTGALVAYCDLDKNRRGRGSA